MFCTKCGNKINEIEAFCSYCGAPVDAEGMGFFSTESAAIDSNPYASAVSSVKNNAYSLGMKRSSYIIQNGVGMIVAFPLFIVGFVYSWRAKKGEKAGNLQEANENAYIAKVLFWTGLAVMLLGAFWTFLQIVLAVVGG